MSLSLLQRSVQMVLAGMVCMVLVGTLTSEPSALAAPAAAPTPQPGGTQSPQAILNAVKNNLPTELSEVKLNAGPNKGIDIVPAVQGTTNTNATQTNPLSFIEWLYTFIGVSAIFITTGGGMYGGFLMLSSFGDEGRYGRGRNIVYSSFIGITLVVLSYAIVQMIVSIARNIPG